jgi:hypothetical protein
MPLSISLATGKCYACGYDPVGFDALACPQCATRNPNPGVGNRYAGRGVLYGLLAGVGIGGVWGFIGYDTGWVGAFVGVLLGAVPGMFLGIVAGLLTAAFTRLSGVR